jgi:antitoxin YefM
MTIIMVMSETLPLADVKARFSEVVDRVATTHDRVVVTRNGRPAAVLVSPDELEALEETLDILSDPDARSRIDEARRAVAEGDVIDEQHLRGLLAELRQRPT